MLEEVVKLALPCGVMPLRHNAAPASAAGLNRRAGAEVWTNGGKAERQCAV